MKNEEQKKAPVLVRRFPFAIEAEMAQALLAEHGISSYVYDLNVNSCYVGAVMGVRLLVDPDNLNEAIDILESNK
ncbi:MAG: putative signal transducing protein [Bacteroidota bacterium]